MSRARIKSLLKFALLLVFVGAAIGFFRYSETGRSIDRERLHSFIESVDPAIARLLYVVLYIIGTVVLLPGILLSFLGAVLFGVWEGTLYTWIGATIGASLSFLVARTLGRDFAAHLVGGKLPTLDSWVRQHGFAGLVFVRLVPLFPFNVVNFGCGLTSLRFRDYVMATALGIVPGTFFYQYVFATLGEKWLSGDFSWGQLMTIELLLPIGLIVAFVAASGFLARRLRGGTTSEGEKSAPR